MPDGERPQSGRRPVLGDHPRQHGLLRSVLSTGMTAAAIGRILGISNRTVSKHIQNAYDKLGVHDRLLVAADRRSTGQLRIPPGGQRVPDMAGT